MEKNKLTAIQKYSETLQACMVNVAVSYLRAAEILWNIKESGEYMGYADHIETFEDYLREMRIGKSTGYNLTAIWENFGKHLHAKKIEAQYYSLVKLLPLAEKIEGKEEEWLKKAELLPYEQFNDELRALKSGRECEHEKTEEITVIKCRYCSKMLTKKIK